MSGKCEVCKAWLMDGECRKCAKNNEEKEKKEKEDKEQRAREQIAKDVEDRKAKLAAGEQLSYEGSKHEVAPETDFKWKFDFSTAPVKDFFHIDWDSAIGVQRSAEGAEGVFFIQTPQGAVCLKSPSLIAGDTFCANLAQRLGINAPNCRIMRRAEGEGKACFEKLLQLDSLRDTAKRTVASGLNKTHLMVMEFVRGEALSAHTCTQMKAIFGEPLSKNGELRLMEIGFMIGFDMLLNNSDRLPFIWDNDGNFDNVMLEEGTGKILVIDNSISSIHPHTYKDNYEKYIKRVSDLTSKVRSTENKVELPESKRIRKALQELSSYSDPQAKGMDIGVEGSLAIQKGLLDFCSACSKLEVEELAALRQQIASIDQNIVGLERVSADFLAGVLGALTGEIRK